MLMFYWNIKMFLLKQYTNYVKQNETNMPISYGLLTSLQNTHPFT